MARLARGKKAWFAAGVLVLALGSAETVLRLWDFSFYFNFGADLLGMPLLDLHKIRRIQNRTVDFDPDLFWKFKPNQVLDAPGVYRKPVHINGHGFRGPDFADAKPAGTYRIVCLGDSSTFGWSVGDDEPFPAQLPKFLRCSGRAVEVLNLGVTGYTSFQGRELMLQYAAAWEPDLVVFAFGPNDRLPALKSDAEHQRDRTWDIGPVPLFLNNFQVYKLIKAGVVYAGNRTRGLSLEPKTYIPLLRRKVGPADYADNARLVKAACDRIGADLVIINVDYPSLPVDHITAELHKQADQHGTAMPAGWETWDGAVVNRELSRDLRVPLIEMRGLFTEDLARIEAGELDPERAAKLRADLGPLAQEEPWRLLMIDNGHPNAWGHEIIARALADAIVTRASFKRTCARGAAP